MKNEKLHDVTIKSIIIGLILVVVNAYWVGIASELWYSVFNTISPFANAIFSIVPLILLNVLLVRLFQRNLFNHAELLIIYIMVTMVTTISGHTFMAILMGTMAQPFWFATPENEWEQLFWRYIPSWFTVRDRSILRGYFEGEASIFIEKHIQAWLTPVLVWSVFIFVALFAMLCINIILRRQWVEREKLSYPLIELPLAMVQERYQFFRAKMMWLGFGVAAGIRIINGFHSLYPIIPAIPTGYEVGQYITEKPWNAIGYTLISFRLSIIGLTYFMPLDLSFSCWFFFWLGKLERVFASAIGWRDLHLNERAAGGWIGIGLIALWISRRHLVEVAKQVIKGHSPLDEAQEPMQYRTAVILLIASFIFLFLFCYQAGMSPWAIIVFYTLFFVMGLSLTRVRAELGPPYHEIILVNPRQVMTEVFGSKRLGGSNLIVITFLYAFNRCNRSHPMPSELESLKIGEQAAMSGSKLVLAMVLAIGVGTVATFVSYLQFLYKFGALAKCRGWVGHFGWESFNPLQSWLQYPRGTNWVSVGFIFGGLGFVFFLMVMRRLFFWWPLHPSGYVLAGASWGGMIYFWFPVFFSWLIKSLLLKHGGIGAYRKAAPLFLGLVFGDNVLWSAWSIVSLAFNIGISSAY
ncbi:hypothetical protein FJZ31_12720 [Candidatus Poribacteria bacterium]|nr:hypothetical protein [Candidatus Poribacteria bacterium]